MIDWEKYFEHIGLYKLLEGNMKVRNESQVYIGKTIHKDGQVKVVF